MHELDGWRRSGRRRSASRAGRRQSRPPTSYTNALKKQQLAAWHYPDQNPSHYEEDHLISLELGGAPWSKKNLWPEPHSQSAKSDPRENAWHRLLCSGTLKQAQARELACKRAHE